MLPALSDPSHPWDPSDPLHPWDPLRQLRQLRQPFPSDP